MNGRGHLLVFPSLFLHLILLVGPDIVLGHGVLVEFRGDVFLGQLVMVLDQNVAAVLLPLRRILYCLFSTLTSHHGLLVLIVVNRALLAVLEETGG